jgi:hypothetical protein
MLFEMVERVRILIKFDQNTANYDEKITQKTSVGDVQNNPGQFHSS